MMTATLSLAAYADQAMSNMDMGGMKMSQKPTASTLSVTAAVSPAAPRSGDNTLDLTVSDATGKPATGLKLTASVAMTSMDMETTHPVFAETGDGHYKATVTFSMDGPWRVVVQSAGRRLATLDFQPGSKAPWKSPQVQATATPGTSSGPDPKATPGMSMRSGKTDSMAGMNMSGKAASPADHASSGPDAAVPSDKTTKLGGAPDTNAMAGMDMGSKTDAMGGMKTGIADMKTATVPQLQEKGTYTATGDEDWKAQAGFGHNAGMVGMMNQMMVGGSGMEGMKMPAMNMKFDEKNYAKPEGDDTAGAGDMAGMDMSSGKTPAKPESKSAAMPGMGGKDSGMKMDTPTPVAPGAPPATDAPSTAPAAAMPLTVTAVIHAPKAGDNALQITVTDAQGKPITGAKVTTSVAMTSMDMGTTHPAVTDKGNGQYTSTANLSMAGPWRVKVKVTPVGQKPQTNTFDFTAK